MKRFVVVQERRGCLFKDSYKNLYRENFSVISESSFLSDLAGV